MVRAGGAVLLGEQAAQGWPEAMGAVVAALVVMWFADVWSKR